MVIEPDEIKKIEPKTAKTMEILEFVKTSLSSIRYFSNRLIIWFPMKLGGGHMRCSPRRWKRAGLAFATSRKLDMHNREYTVFLRPHEGGMMLHTMYYAEEVRKLEGFGAPDVELKKMPKSKLHISLSKRWRLSGSQRNITTAFRTISRT